MPDSDWSEGVPSARQITCLLFIVISAVRSYSYINNVFGYCLMSHIDLVPVNVYVKAADHVTTKPRSVNLLISRDSDDTGDSFHKYQTSTYIMFTSH